MLPLISCLFLAKFDVRSGYKVEWLRSNNEEIYSGRDLEFKSFPSGLHSVSADTVCFVQPKDSGSDDTTNLLYGMAVFRQNRLDLRTSDSESSGVDRSKVRMYSLGILIDPEHLNSTSGMSASLELPWKPKIYSACWQYREDLGRMLASYVDSGDNDAHFTAKLEKFFEKHRFRVPYPEVLTPPSKHCVSSTSSSTSLSNDLGLTAADETPEDPEHNHLVYGLEPLFRTLGPLLYKVWKLALLRKKILFYTHANGSVIKPNDPQPAFKIEQMSRFVYCVSLVSSIPKEIRSSMVKSGVKQFDALEFLAPVYNLCVNDIPFVRKLECGYIGSTTDQILLDKSNLYDYCVELGTDVSVSDNQHTQQTASHRDLETFQFIGQLTDSEENWTEPDFSGQCDGASVREMIWKGFSWWATAGESSQELDERFQLEAGTFAEDAEPSEGDQQMEHVITLVGYFQKLTRRLFSVLTDEVINNASDVSNEQEESESGDVVWIQPQDMYEMGLDPFSQGDCEFVEQLVEVWWGKTARLGTACKLCCLY